MEIVVTYLDGQSLAAVLLVRGEITVESYQQLQQEAQAVFEAGARNLVLDLADVTFVSSAGLRAIYHIFALLQGGSAVKSDEAVRRGIVSGTFHSPHLKLLNPTPHVLQTLRAAGFDMFLEIHSSLKEAVASF